MFLLELIFITGLHFNSTPEFEFALVFHLRNFEGEDAVEGLLDWTFLDLTKDISDSSFADYSGWSFGVVFLNGDDLRPEFWILTCCGCVKTFICFTNFLNAIC